MRLALAATLLVSGLPLRAQQLPIEGRADSPVRVLIFEDLQCPDCARFRQMLETKLLPMYGARVAFVHRDFPLPRHAWARQAAIASRYLETRKPGLGAGFRREALMSLARIRETGFEKFLESFVRGKQLDAAAAAASLQDPNLQALVEKDFQEGVARGVSKTPTVIVNGKPFIETFTFEEISAAIEQALAGSGR
ncbi:MAG: thioredoxin domain-containing protein [Bryobacterales bacterium]|nr:thioredoxin domain-containing protein [Bryobacterales bacterium]